MLKYVCIFCYGILAEKEAVYVARFLELLKNVMRVALQSIAHNMIIRRRCIDYIVTLQLQSR